MAEELDNSTELQENPPKFLRGTARTMYNNLRPILTSRGTKKISQSVLEQYCMSYGISRTAYDDIQERGLIDKDTGKKNPNVATYENAVKNIRSLGNDLGLTPTSQVQLQKLIMESTSEDDDETFEEKAGKYKF